MWSDTTFACNPTRFRSVEGVGVVRILWVEAWLTAGISLIYNKEFLVSREPDLSS